MLHATPTLANPTPVGTIHAWAADLREAHPDRLEHLVVSAAALARGLGSLSLADIRGTLALALLHGYAADHRITLAELLTLLDHAADDAVHAVDALFGSTNRAPGGLVVDREVHPVN